MGQEKKEHHYFVCTADCWVTNVDLYAALERLRKETGMKEAPYMVMKVPLPHDANYDIRWYTPQVDGVELIAEGRFSGDRK